MRKIMMIMMIIGCNKNNFNYDNKYKNDIDYYFNNIDKLDEDKIPYIIEKLEEGNNKALFLYINLLTNYPNNKKLISKINLLKGTDNLIDYLYSNNYFNELGDLYHFGVEGKLKPYAEKAIEYYTKAIEMGSFKAANNLGYLYEIGIEEQVEPNVSKAIEYYIKAVDMGNAKASYNLGCLYMEGVEGELKPNIDKAIEYYNKAIEMGDSDAANELADLYRYGVNEKLERSIYKAIEYLNIAKSMGYNISKGDLNILYNNLIKEKLDISVDEVVKCLFDLYDKYKYKNSIINSIFRLYTLEPDNVAYYKYESHVSNKLFSSNIKLDISEEDLVRIYVDNIKACYGVVLGQKIANDSSSTVSSFNHEPINSNLFISYSYICDYLESLLELLKYFNKHNFMIDCFRSIDKSKFSNKEEDYVKLMNINGIDYVCLGENEVYKKLVGIIDRKEDLIDYVNKVINKINSNTDLYQVLKEIIDIEENLYNIIEYSSIMRNKIFIEKYAGLFEDTSI